MTVSTTTLTERLRSGLYRLPRTLGDTHERSFDLITADEFAEMLTRAAVEQGLERPNRPGDYAGIPAGGDRLAPRFTIIPSGSDNLVLSVEDSRTESGEVVPFGTAPAAECGMAFTDSTVTPARIAAWVSATRGAWLDGTGSAGIVQQVVRSLLVDELGRVLDDQALNGDPLLDELHGILTDASLVEQPLSTDTPAKALLRAVGTIRGGDFTGSIDAAMNASDAVNLAFSDDFDARMNAVDRLGFRDLVPSSMIPQGTIVVGDFAAGVHLYVRSPVSVTISDSHASFFLEGKVAIMAEVRAELRLVRPAAVVAVTGIPA